MGWSGTSVLKITDGVERREYTGFGDLRVGREDTTKGDAGTVDQPLGRTGGTGGAELAVDIPNFVDANFVNFAVDGAR